MNKEVSKMKELIIKHYKSIMVVLVIAMLVFIPFYTKYLPNPDTLIYNNGGYYRGIYWELSLGRWGLMFLDTILGGINSPVLSSIIYICTICLGIAFLADLFEVESERNIIFFGVLLLITPFTGNILTYYYCSYDYGFAFLFMVLACWFYYRVDEKWMKLLLCSLFVCLSFSLYQSYAGVGAVLAIGVTLHLILKKKETGIEAIKKMFGFAGNACCGGILYVIILAVGLKVLHTDMASYKGADEISLINIVSNLGNNLTKAYYEFASYYFGHEFIGNHFLNQYFVMLIFIISVVCILVSLQKNRSFVDKCVVIILLLMIPLGANIIDFIVTGSFLSIQATSGIGICLPVLYILYTDSEVSNKRVGVILTGLVVIYLWTNCIQIETDAMALEYSYEEGIYVLDQVNDKINEMIEKNGDLPVVIMGNPEFGNYPSAPGISHLSSDYATEGLFWDYRKNSWYEWTKYMKDYFYANYTFTSVDDALIICESEAFHNMEVFPKQGSVQIKDNVIIIKISELKMFKD